jgi:hypothetical protein
MGSNLTITVVGLERVQAGLNQYKDRIMEYLYSAVEQVSRTILETRGLKLYPPETEANRPPTPYYIRGVGTQYKNSNSGSSEQYGTQFYTEEYAEGMKIGNRATYARYLTDDEEQTKVMAEKGWRKLIEVAREKLPDIVRTMQGWVDKLVKYVGL